MERTFTFLIKAQTSELVILLYKGVEMFCIEMHTGQTLLLK